MRNILFTLGFLFLCAPAAMFAEGSADDYYADDDYGYEYDDSGDYDDGEYDEWDYDDYEDDYDYYEDDYTEEDPVFEIIRSGSLEEIRAAVGDKVDSEGNTMLMTACASDRDRDILEYLLTAGARIEAKNFSGETPLMIAGKNGSSPETVAYLLQHGASFSSRDDDGRTVLMHAAGNENPAVLGWLLSERMGDIKALVSMKDEYRRNALSYLCGNPEADEGAVKRLISLGADVNAADSDGSTPLAFAVSSDLPLPVIKALVAAGAKVNVRDEYGTTPLMFAASDNSDPEVARFLLDSGAPVNDVDDYGYSALMYVFYNADADSLYPIFRDAGADPSLRGSDGMTALMLAAQYEAYDAGESLAAGGVNVNAIDDFGKTALMYACEENDDDRLIRSLLDSGADISPVDENGMTAYDYAMDNWYLEDSDQLDRLMSPLTAL